MPIYPKLFDRSRVTFLLPLLFACAFFGFIFLAVVHGNATTDLLQSPGSPVDNSELATIAASMTPGSWAPLDTKGFDSGSVLVPPAGGSITEYTDQAVWDPKSKAVLLLGGAHPSHPATNCEATLFLKYDEFANSWSKLPSPCSQFDNAFADGIGHAYNHQAIDTVNDIFYHRQYNSNKVMQFTVADGNWSQIAPIPTTTYQVAGALVFFPERNGLVFIDGDWGVWFYSTEHRRWTEVASTDGGGPTNLPRLMIGHYHDFAQYSPQKHLVIFGGGNGSNNIYEMSQNGSIRQMKGSPVSLGITSSINVVDPISGDLLVWDGMGKSWDYDPVSDVWKNTDVRSPIIPNGSFTGVNDIVAAPISTYGVVMFITYDFAHSSVFLYKPADSSGLAKSLSGVSVAPPPRSSNNNPAPQAPPPSSEPVQDARSSAAASAEVPPTVPPASGASSGTSADADYQKRCNSPGVVRCIGFDSPADVSGSYGDNTGLNLSGATKPVLDTSVKASGDSSLKFTIPSNSGADSSGSFFANFSKNLNTQFGENSDFFIQWRQRFSPEFLMGAYPGAEGWKQVIIGTGDRPHTPYASCTSLEVVVLNSYQRGFPEMYDSCTGSASHGPYDPFQQHYGAYDFLLQNARQDPHCLYSQGKTNPATYFPPEGNCFRYFPNEWMTFQVEIKTGPRVKDEFTKSYVRLWMARQGRPPQLVLSWGPYNLSGGNPSEDQKFGKIWLLPYNTNRDPHKTDPTAYTWYDELIISTKRIPDPQ